MASISREETIALLQRYLENKQEIDLAYLFGSYAREDVEHAKDIDIGIFLTGEAIHDPWYRVRLERELAEEIPMERRFDVRILNHASIPFAYNVIFHGIRLVVREDDFRVEFETRILLLWYDMKPTWDAFYKEQSEVLAR